MTYITEYVSKNWSAEATSSYYGKGSELKRKAYGDAIPSSATTHVPASAQLWVSAGPSFSYSFLKELGVGYTSSTWRL